MKVYFKQLFVLVLSIFFINVLMVYGVQEVTAKNEPLLAKHVSGDETYTKYEIGDYIVYHHQRMIGDAVVEKDFKVIQFHKHTKKLHKKIDTFRKELPARIETVMSKEKAHASVEGKIIYSMKMIIHPQSDIFKFKPTPQNPCHVVWHEVSGEIIITVFDAVTGKKIGNGISPPSSRGLAFSGPIDYSPCNPTYVWQAWIDSGSNFFTNMGYPTTKRTNPQKSVVALYVQDSLYPVIYEFGHGSSTSFVNHCNGGFESIYASDVESWMSSVPARWFVFLGHCDGMCQTGDNTLSYEYRKGSSSQTTTVGYCGMSHGSCDTCWYSSLDWQNRMFSYIESGYTVYHAFTQATADYPHCSNCVLFAGDDNYFLPNLNVKNEPLKYGQYVNIQNAFDNWATYLDICNPASREGYTYNVSTSSSTNRDGRSGTWEIISASGKAVGSPVLVGDNVYLENKYKSGSYLDTCDTTACGGKNLYIVLTSSNPDRAGSGSGTWEIISASGKAVGSPVLNWDSVHLKNKYKSGSYLDVCGGASCGGNTYNVSTSSKTNRDHGSGTWRFVVIPLLEYGHYAHIQNAYDNWASYLDICNPASCEQNLYSVSTSREKNRDSGSGTWEIISASGKAVSSPVRFGDSVHLENKYKSGSYLDTCGTTTCGGNKYRVSTSSNPDRVGSGSGTWEIISASGEALGSLVLPWESVHLRSQYGGTESYLDVCGGAAFCSNIYNVSTSSSANRDSGSGTWKFVEIPALKYGQYVHIQNGYDNWASYLDVCGGATCEDSKYNVSTSSRTNRDNGSGTWEIISDSGEAVGSPVRFGDSVHLKNKYAPGSYLDTCDPASCGDNMYNVSTSLSPNRASGSGTWVIISASGKAVGTPVLPWDSVHLKNKYDTGSYLDTCGTTSCGGNKYNVSTSSSPNKASGSGTWRFVEMH